MGTHPESSRLTDLTVDPLPVLRMRRSTKWSIFPDDVLPLPIAETDFALADPIAAALSEAIERSDTGYASPVPDLAESLSEFAAARWNWQIDPGQVTSVLDVGVGVVELLRVLASGGGTVVISPPVYPPFYHWIDEVGGQLREVPLVQTGQGWRLDLLALERAFADRPAAYVLCNPHNPVGRVHDREELAALVHLATRYGVTLVSDEIHAPLILTGGEFTPILTIPGAADVAVSLVSASKAWNLAGLKCATVVTGSRPMADLVERFPADTRWRIGHFGVLASVAAYRDGDVWLDQLIGTLDRRREQIDGFVRATPGISWHLPEATYLAWLDCSRLDLDDPQAHFLEHGKVAVESGLRFGGPGQHHVRLNFGTSEEILDEAFRRLRSCL
ncbi:MalY/PatB family protein [Williamsia sp.]|uniref:MalY/PatB family protein n=1 Tax=Williamsia sp. TaxID=1872085 RepID=UPI002F9273AC